MASQPSIAEFLHLPVRSCIAELDESGNPTTSIRDLSGDLVATVAADTPAERHVLAEFIAASLNRLGERSTPDDLDRPEHPLAEWRREQRRLNEADRPSTPLEQLRKAFDDWDQDEATAPPAYEIYRAVSRILEVNEPWAASGDSAAARPVLADRLLPLAERVWNLIEDDDSASDDVREGMAAARGTLRKMQVILREPGPEGGEANKGTIWTDPEAVSLVPMATGTLDAILEELRGLREDARKRDTDPGPLCTCYHREEAHRKDRSCLWVDCECTGFTPAKAEED